MEGIITKGVAGTYTVLTNGGSYNCTARGVFRKRETTPLVGDRVQISVANESEGTIHTILPRVNQLRRPPAANIGQVIITVAARQPPFSPWLLDRFLIMAEFEGIPILICVNKSDLMNENNQSLFAPYEQAGYDLVYTAAKTGDGLEELRQKMAGRLNLFAGPSGVGKSSLINALSPAANMETGGLSAKLSRGKHTTRHTEIFPLGSSPESGSCFDTPGFTALDISYIDKNSIAGLFREFVPFSEECRFNDCLHHHENDCAVKERIGLDIHPVRYESYLKILSEA